MTEHELNLDNLNSSELAEMAKDFDPNAHRDLPRETLYALITGGQAEPLKVRPINKRRLHLMSYINEYWDQVSPLLSCPAKTQDPHACFECTDIQSLTCILENKDKIEGT